MGQSDAIRAETVSARTGSAGRRFMNLTQMLHRAAVSDARSIATRFDGRDRSWADLKGRVARMAGALRQLGVSEGDRVAILALNQDRYTEYFFAVWWAGGVVVPLNTRWSAVENAYSLNDSGARVLFVDKAYLGMVPTIREKAGSVDTLVCLDTDACPEGMYDYEDLIRRAAPVDDAFRCEDDLAGLFYTGGTTGFPKGVMLGHRGLWFNAMMLASQCFLDPCSVVLHAAPMFHLADGCMGLCTSLVAARHVYVSSFEPNAVLDVIESEQVTHLLLVPTMISMLLQSPAFSTERVKSVKTLLYGASPMPEGLLRLAISKMPHVRLVQAYGQTEMSPVVSLLGPADHVPDGPNSHRLASAGKIAIGCEAKVVDDAGAEVKPGNVGEVVARSPGSMLGYWNLPEQTAATLENGWVKTGDGGYFDEDGYLYIVDRMKDMIVTGGENVFSVEVENAVSTFPGVVAVAVIGIPSERWGEAVHAIVVAAADADLSEADIIDHCREQIANYKLPRSVEFRTRPLPVSAAGKVLKRELRAPYWKSKGRAVN